MYGTQMNYSTFTMYFFYGSVSKTFRTTDLSEPWLIYKYIELSCSVSLKYLVVSSI